MHLTLILVTEIFRKMTGRILQEDFQHMHGLVAPMVKTNQSGGGLHRARVLRLFVSDPDLLPGWFAPLPEARPRCSPERIRDLVHRGGVQ